MNSIPPVKPYSAYVLTYCPPVDDLPAAVSFCSGSGWATKNKCIVSFPAASRPAITGMISIALSGEYSRFQPECDRNETLPGMSPTGGSHVTT